MNFKRHREVHQRERTASIMKILHKDNHLPSKSISDRLGDRNYSCHACSYQSKNRGSLTRHEQQCHPQNFRDKENVFTKPLQHSSPKKDAIALKISSPRKLENTKNFSSHTKPVLVNKETQTGKSPTKRKRKIIDINVNISFTKDTDQSTDTKPAVNKSVKVSSLSSDSDSDISWDEVSP